MSQISIDPRLRALSIRQPWAELILRGVKTVEYRSRPTRVRGVVYLYAGLGRYLNAEEAEWARKFKLDIDALPRGLIVGTVEIFDACDEEWFLRNPQRLAQPVAPQRHPTPVFWYPFAGSALK